MNQEYTPEELGALGKTDKKDTYLVNKIIPTYDPSNYPTEYDGEYVIKPYILKLYSDC